MPALQFDATKFTPSKPHTPCGDTTPHHPHPHGVGDLRFAAVDMKHCHGAICFSARVHPAHGTCKGLDFDTWFERTQDAAL